MLVKNAIGFMQGRLTEKNGFFPQEFPEKNWEEELYLAGDLGFDCMEWMFNKEGWNRNPILLQDSVERIINACRDTNIRISGICANYFMQCSLYGNGKQKDNLLILQSLIQSAELLGCSAVILPMFDASELRLDDKSVYVLVNQLPDNDIPVLFESNERLIDLKKWISGFRRGNVGICYDIGNAAGMGYNPAKELSDYGSIVKNVHLKDKKIGGTTVMLGEGDADFQACFDALEKYSYEGCYILESYYQEAVKDTCKNLSYIKEMMR